MRAQVCVYIYVATGLELLAKVHMASSYGKFISNARDMHLYNWLLQYKDVIGGQRNMQSFFLCRWKNCLYVCRSVDWPSTDSVGGGHYWCPKCARLYEPWVTSQERVNANKVMVYQMDGAVSTEFYPCLTTRKGQRYCIVPFKWTDTILMNIEDKFKRVASGVMDEISDIAPGDRLEFIKRNCEKQGMHSLFHHSLPTEEEKEKMRKKNECCGKGQPKKNLDLVKFEANGSYGLHLDGHMDKLMDPLREDDMLRNWLLVKAVEENLKKTIEQRKKQKQKR